MEVLQRASRYLGRLKLNQNPTGLLVFCVKELFNHFFRDDLYRPGRREDIIILSSGTASEQEFPAPSLVKNSLLLSLKRDWYGYSDSRGREATRDSIAALENARVSDAAYEVANVAVTMGATAALSSLFAMLSKEIAVDSPAVCAIPGYPPHVKSIAQHFELELVPVQATSGHPIELERLYSRITPQTPVVFLQTVINPSGMKVPEEALAKLIENVPGQTLIILDEAHEDFGEMRFGTARSRSNVIRVVSLSKDFCIPGFKAGWIVADRSIIDSFYEHASTHYGGPPSLFALAIEVVALYERLLQEGAERPGPSDLARFPQRYRPSLTTAQRDFISYRQERQTHYHELNRRRLFVTSELGEMIPHSQTPLYGVNVPLRIPAAIRNSYHAYRSLLDEENTACFPGSILFLLNDNELRLTFARRMSELRRGVARIKRWAKRHEA